MDQFHVGVESAGVLAGVEHPLARLDAGIIGRCVVFGDESACHISGFDDAVDRGHLGRQCRVVDLVGVREEAFADHPGVTLEVVGDHAVRTRFGESGYDPAAGEGIEEDQRPLELLLNVEEGVVDQSQ